MLDLKPDKEGNMAEKDLTKDLTRVIKGADKLMRDVEKDIRQIMAALAGVKATILDIKDRIKKPEDE